MAYGISKKITLENKRKNFLKFYPKKKNFLYKLISLILDYCYLIKVKIYNLKLFLTSIIHVKKISPQEKIINIECLDFNEVHHKELNNKGYIFFENFLDINSHQLLNENFPSKCFLRKHININKNYYWGYIYKQNIKNNKMKFFDKFRYLKNCYQFLLSEKFKKKIINLTGEKNLYCEAISTTYAEQNSFLAPHKDGIFKKKTNRINFIYFIDGINNDPIFSGSTGFYKDNEFKEPIFIPKTIKNSLLVYKNSFNHYHGFDYMKKNYFRKSIIFSFKEVQ